MPSLTATFRPATGLANPHLQTAGARCGASPELPRERERLWLADGDFLTSTGMARTRPMRRWCWCCMG
jgi:predicted alpha/beta-fold hydrolase